MIKAILLSVLIAGPVVSPRNTEAIKAMERELYPEDRQLIMLIKEEARRIRLIRERSASLPVCPIEPDYYWNLNCA